MTGPVCPTFSESSSPHLDQGTRADYARQRLEPRPGEFGYLCNSDLRSALESVATEERLRLLDFGADLSPYRALFPNADYRRADIGDAPDLDYQIRADGTVPEEPETFDFVLSTQVAEHVPSSRTYFSECFRLLRPGGRVVISTHGSFEDHSFPHDYQRWTADGLRRDLAACGFLEIVVQKLTTGPRAVMFHLERCLDTTSISRKSFFGLAWWITRVLEKFFRAPIHRIVDSALPGYRVVAHGQANQNFYVCVLARATKPLGKA